MGRRHRIWAARSRASMTLALGGCCVMCQARDDLTFDCISPMGNDHHGGSAPQRISFYRAQMQCGNVQLLCARCNSLKSDLPADIWWHCLEVVRGMWRTAHPGISLQRLPPEWSPQLRELFRSYLASLQDAHRSPRHD